LILRFSGTSSRKARTTLLKKTPQLETVLLEVAAWLEENEPAM